MAEFLCLVTVADKSTLSKNRGSTFSPPFTDTVIHVADPADRSVQCVAQQPAITTGPPAHAPAQPVLHPAGLATKQCTKVRVVTYMYVRIPLYLYLFKFPHPFSFLLD